MEILQASIVEWVAMPSSQFKFSSSSSTSACRHLPVSQQQQGLVLMGSVLLCAVVRIAASFYHLQTWETKFHLLFSSFGT